MRPTYVSRTVNAGCFQCGGADAMWFGPQAQGTAARHHDATGHTTWADVSMGVTYGDGPRPTEKPAPGPGEEEDHG